MLTLTNIIHGVRHRADLGLSQILKYGRVRSLDSRANSHNSNSYHHSDDNSRNTASDGTDGRRRGIDYT